MQEILVAFERKIEKYSGKFQVVVEVKPSFSIIIVVILDEGGSVKKYNIKFIFLGPYIV